MPYSFRMNNREWKILEISQDEMKKILKDYDGKVENYGQYFGSTFTKNQVIYLDKDMHRDQKRQTLLHELMHCYIYNYLFELETLNLENLCDISACSHDIIHEIVENYFKNTTL